MTFVLKVANFAQEKAVSIFVSTTLCIMTLSIATLSIKGSFTTPSTNDTRHNSTLYQVPYADYPNVECRILLSLGRVSRHLIFTIRTNVEAPKTLTWLTCAGLVEGLAGVLLMLLLLLLMLLLDWWLELFRPWPLLLMLPPPSAIELERASLKVIQSRSRAT
jgi:hypothetical protein